MNKPIFAGLALMFLGRVATGSDLRPNEVIIGGGTGEANGIWISAPSIFLRQGNPGVVVGMVRAQGGETEIPYALIIKGDEARTVQTNCGSRCGVAGSIGNSQGSLANGERKVNFEYKIEFDPMKKRAAVESMIINGKGIDLEKGRLILVDLSTGELKWKPVVAAFPKAPVYPETTEGVESQAKDLLLRLKRENAKVREFLK